MSTMSGNNKGLLCPFKPITCQEGRCRECQIYLDWRKRDSAASSRALTGGKRENARL